MKTNIKLLKKKRFYSQDFKKELVSEFESGKFSVPQLEKLHGISNSLIYIWIYKFSTSNEKGFRVVEMKASSKNKLKQLEDRVKELEGDVGRKQIQLDYLEKIIDLAKSDLDIDIKKTTPPSH